MTIPFGVIRISSRVKEPVWRLSIAGTDITREITPLVTSVTYTDYATKKSDDIEIEVEDSAGRWKNAWYPTKGDRAELFIGYFGEKLLPCGRFQIDEVEPSGPPDKVTIKALATGVIPDLRTKRSKAYEGQTLKQIAEAVAARHSMTLVGEIEEIIVERMTQREEDDLTFLMRVAEAYGYLFSVRDTSLVFYSIGKLEERPPIVTVRRRDVIEYRLKDKTHAVYKACQVSYENPVTKKVITRTVEAKGIVSGDVLKLTVRVENEAQAEAQARAALKSANSLQATGTVTIEGEPRLVAGTTVQLEGWGRFDGKYFAEESQHSMTRGDGYRTTPTLKKIA
jgi:phage protein D